MAKPSFWSYSYTVAAPAADNERLNTSLNFADATFCAAAVASLQSHPLACQPTRLRQNTRQTDGDLGQVLGIQVQVEEFMHEVDGAAPTLFKEHRVTIFGKAPAFKGVKRSLGVAQKMQEVGA